MKMCAVADVTDELMRAARGKSGSATPIAIPAVPPLPVTTSAVPSNASAKEATTVRFARSPSSHGESSGSKIGWVSAIAVLKKRERWGIAQK